MSDSNDRKYGANGAGFRSSRSSSPRSPGLALITGAGSGIGRALALELASQGERLLITDLHEDTAEAVAMEARERGADAEVAALDVTSWHDVSSLINAHANDLKALYLSAGVGLAGELRDLSIDDWQPALQVNLMGVIHPIHAAWPHLISRGGGRIVVISSGAALAPRPGMVPYATSKAALTGLTSSLRAEGAGYGIRVHAVCPGYIGTGLMDRTRYVGVDPQKLKDAIPIRPTSAESCARRILRGANANRAVILVGNEVKLEGLLQRFVPGLVGLAARWRAAHFRKARKACDANAQQDASAQVGSHEVRNEESDHRPAPGKRERPEGSAQ